MTTAASNLISDGNKTSFSKDIKTWSHVLDPKLLGYVPEHWLKFEPPAKYQHYVLGVLYFVILVPAITGNGTIIWLFCRCKSLRTPSNILVVNLAISDLIQNLKMPVFVYNSFKCGPAMGELGCQLYGFFGGMAGTSAILTIASMAWERFHCITYPLSPTSRLNRIRAMIIVSIIWFYSFVFAFPPVIHLFNRYVPEGYLTSCSFDYLSSKLEFKIFILVYFVAAWVFPMFIITFCYIGIVVAVRRSNNSLFATELRSSPDQRNISSLTKARKTEIRLAKISFLLISLWLASWTPYAIVALLGLYDNSLLTPTVSMFPALFAKMSSVINPFVYGLAHPRFKREIKRRFCGQSFKSEMQSQRISNIQTEMRHAVSTSHGSSAALPEIPLEDVRL